MQWFLVLFFVLCNLTVAYPTFSDKAIICGVCKNVSSNLPIMIRSIEEIGDLFAEYSVCIYENNSTDSTVQILRDWERSNARVTIISENLSREELLRSGESRTWDNMPFRTEVIARARNIVLERVLSSTFEDYKYVFMLDMDFKTQFDIKGIIHSLNVKTEWDAICANGITDEGKTYDRFALRDYFMPFGPELLGDEWWRHVMVSPLILKRDSKLKPVYSAFGGLTIYKRSSIKGCSYSGIVTPELEKVVQKILFDEKNRHHPEILKYLNRDDSKNTVFFLNNTPNRIKWICNSGGYDVPVSCEHTTFHAMMFCNGCDKIFINPRMIVRY